MLFSVIPFSLGPLWCVIHIPNDEGQCRLDNPKNKSKIKSRQPGDHSWGGMFYINNGYLESGIRTTIFITLFQSGQSTQISWAFFIEPRIPSPLDVYLLMYQWLAESGPFSKARAFQARHKMPRRKLERASTIETIMNKNNINFDCRNQHHNQVVNELRLNTR